MDYRECLQYLDRLGNEVLTMKFGLDSIRRLLAELGDPHLRYPCLLVAGTNGKGSVARFIGAILTAAGYRTGIYTSPHLVDVEERIVIDDRPVSRDRFARSFTRVVEAIPRLGRETHPTYFETLTATAFQEFATDHVEVAVLEIGMGGRLDSTNVVDPLVSIITPIGLDHRKALGDTVEEIAAEKAGIIHPGRPVVSAPQKDAAMRVLRRRARDLGSSLEAPSHSEIETRARSDGGYDFVFRRRSVRLKVLGRHQVENAALAILAADQLRRQGWDLPDRAIVEGLSKVEPHASPRRLSADPDVLVDGGHNPDAARNLFSFLMAHTRPPRALVLGMMRDKEIEAFVEILRPAFSTIHLTPIDSARAATMEELARLVPDGKPAPNPLRAIRSATATHRTVVVAGSYYLAGEVVREFSSQLPTSNS